MAFAEFLSLCTKLQSALKEGKVVLLADQALLIEAFAISAYPSISWPIRSPARSLKA